VPLPAGARTNESTRVAPQAVARDPELDGSMQDWIGGHGKTEDFLRDGWHWLSNGEACWGGCEFPATGGGHQVALRFNEKFKFDSSLERGVLNIIKNVAFLWTA